MSGEEKNILEYRQEDEGTIKELATMSNEKKTLLKGIVIGLQLQGQQSAESVVQEAG